MIGFVASIFKTALAANRVACSQYDQDFDTMPEFGDHVDNEIFSQILEMDDSQEARDFSEPLVTNFFEQASETFEQMAKAL
jgi:osomolarity two-component system phosphorelay intermediate protein YPD1